jgi:hypothetical protein
MPRVDFQKEEGEVMKKEDKFPVFSIFFSFVTLHGDVTG